MNHFKKCTHFLDLCHLEESERFALAYEQWRAKKNTEEAQKYLEAARCHKKPELCELDATAKQSFQNLQFQKMQKLVKDNLKYV